MQRWAGLADKGAMTVAEHLVAHVRGGAKPLLGPGRARWLWVHLRRAVPDALGCLLMPDHVHLVAPPGARARLIRVLAAFAARFGIRFDVAQPQPAASQAIARRALRYVFFNPVRAGLVEDPWMWPWSTLRDLVGAVHDPWTPVERVARRLGRNPTGLIREVTTTADQRPRSPGHASVDVASIEAIRRAVAASLRIDPDSVMASRPGRRLTVQACYAIGSPNTRTLAQRLSLAPRTIRDLRRPPHPALPAVLLCLSDPRLSASLAFFRRKAAGK